jgi:hypothetical protein
MYVDKNHTIDKKYIKNFHTFATFLELVQLFIF